MCNLKSLGGEAFRVNPKASKIALNVDYNR